MNTKLPDVEVDTTHINLQRLDQINELKGEFQKSMPLVELLKIKDPPSSFRGLERDQMLSIMGFTRAEIEIMTGFKQNITLEIDDSADIFISGKDRPEEFQAFKTRERAEFEFEYERILSIGIALGSIEETLHPEPKTRDRVF